MWNRVLTLYEVTNLAKGNKATFMMHALNKEMYLFNAAQVIIVVP